jgi:hypothetical protein
MRTRTETLLWMKDLIEHMNRCHEQLEWAEDGPASSFLTDSLMVDLGECRKLCEQLQGQAAAPRSGRSLASAWA